MKMLNREYKLLNVRLTEIAAERTFFAFADTVSALNYQKTNDPHGWIGLRFQLEPNGQPNDVVIHVRMKDNDNVLQQQALGIIGVNLMFGCFYYHEQPEILLQSLMDDLSPDRIEIDMIRFSGHDFRNVDDRLMSLHLVKNGFTNAALFGPDGNVMQPSEAFYKKHIVAVRGRFRPVTNVSLDMIKKGLKQFESEPDVDDDKVVSVAELTLKNLQGGNEHINEKDFLDRVDILCTLGQTVLISNFHEYYRLVEYLSTFTKLRMGLILGMPNLDYIFEEKHYHNISGGILAAFSALFAPKIKLYLHPTLSDNGHFVTSQEFTPPPHLKGLFQYMKDNDKFADIQNYDKDLLTIKTDDVLELIQTGEPGWEELVPPPVVKLIKESCLFGYPCEVTAV
jgi:hypothetical protein